MGLLLETVEGEIVLIPTNNDTRRLAGAIALGQYLNEPCRICRQLLVWQDLVYVDGQAGAVFAGYSRDGEARAAHKVCWENFIELLQALPAERLYELTSEKEN